MERIFETPEPIQLHVELGKGRLTVNALETTTTTVSVEGDRADDVEITQQGRQIAVIAPRTHGFFGDDTRLEIEISIPNGSDLSTKTGSADQRIHGAIAHAQLKTGSGDIKADTFSEGATIETGSGDVTVSDAATLQLKSGSGDIAIEVVGGDCGVSTGSGDVTIGAARAAVLVKTGSGDLQVNAAHADVAFNGASGDLAIGAFHKGGLTAKTASGDVRVGVPPQIPVWTDVNTVTGSIRSNLHGAGEPTADQDYIELRAKTVSGDITFEQI